MQKRNMGEIKDTLVINGREAVTITRAIDILEEVTGHRYTRDSVYRMFERGDIQAERTEATNLYYVDSLRGFKREKQSGRRKEQKAYSEEDREKALELFAQNKNAREVADLVGITRQTARNWKISFKEQGKLVP